MSHSISCFYTHIIFSTKHRVHFINDDVAPRLHCNLRAICGHLGCPPVEVGGWYDHVHILCLLSRNIALKTMLEELKKTSSKWIKPLHPDCTFFYWQAG